MYILAYTSRAVIILAFVFRSLLCQFQFWNRALTLLANIDHWSLSCYVYSHFLLCVCVSVCVCDGDLIKLIY